MQTTLSRLSSVSLTACEAANDYTDGRAPQHMQSPGEPRPSQVSFGSSEMPLAYSSASMCPSQHASASKNNSNRQTQKAAPERINCLSSLTTRPNVDSITLATAGGIFRIPTCPPGLSFTSSPFFKVIEVIRPPTILSPSELNFIPGKRPYERAIGLKISIDQAEAITYHSQRLDDKRLDFGVQVIMRFAKLEPSDLVNLRIGEPKQQQPPLAPQPDNFPIHLMLHVNGRPAQLPPLLPTTRPGLDGRRNARPVNITPLLRVSPAVSNTVKLVWTHDYATYSYFYYAVYLARKRSTRELCEALRRHSFQSASVTKQKIIEKLASTAASSNTTEDADLVIENTLPVQLLCPLSKCRIDLPVRGQNCQHIQCYDANTYLLINERKPAWKCPVCDVPAPFHELLVDGLMLEILADTMAENLEEIVFREDSSWSPVGKFGSPSNSQHATGAAVASASWADKSPSFPKQQQPLSCSTCPLEMSTPSSQRFFQPSEDTPVSKAVGCGSSTASGSASSAPTAPTGLESRKRSLPVSSVGASFSLPRSSPTSSASSSQAPESEPGLTIDLTESDEESEVSGKRRPSESFFLEAIRPRSVGKPPTETNAAGLRRPSSLNSGGFSHMAVAAAAAFGGAAGASSTAGSPVVCMASTPTTSSTTAQRRGQKPDSRIDAHPHYYQQHSYPPPGQLRTAGQQQQPPHHCESAGGSPSTNPRGISAAAAAAAVSGAASSPAPFASAMLACGTEQFYSAMLTNSVAAAAAAAAARSSSNGGGGGGGVTLTAAAAVSTATNGGSPSLHKVPSTAALRSRSGQPPSVLQSPSAASRPVDYTSHIQRSQSLNEAHHHPVPKQRTLLDPTFKWRVPSPPSSAAAAAQGGTPTFPLRPNTCSPQEQAVLQEAFRRQHLSSPGGCVPFLATPHYSSSTPPNSAAPHTASPSGPSSSFMMGDACGGNRFRPTLRSQQQQVNAASVAAAAAAAAAATLSSMQQPAAAYHQHHLPAHCQPATAGSASASSNPLSSMSCLIDAQRSAALLAASSPAVARAAEAWLARSMFGMAVAAASASANHSGPNDGPYHHHHHHHQPSSFGHSEQPGGGGGGSAAMDPRPGWPYASSPHQPRPPHF